MDSFTYRLTVNGQPFEGTFAAASECQPAYIRFWNYNAGTGDERKFFIGGLSITGAPRPVLTFSAEVAVTRAASSNAVNHTVAVAAAGDGLVATVSSLDGLSNNIWRADTLSGGGWNWSLLPGGEYELVPSNNTVRLTPGLTNGLMIISIGKPGGT